MAEVVGSRIGWLIDDRRTSQSAVARAIGVSQPSIGRLISGETRETGKLLELARFLKTTPEYIVGETNDDAPTGSVADRRLDYHAGPVSDDALSGIMLPQLEVGYSMGAGSVFDDYQPTAMVPFPREWLRPIIAGTFAELFVARGEGDSMVPTLLDGDLVIVDTAQKQIRQQDRLWCLSYGDLGMIKRVRALPGGTLEINSDNPAVTPISAADGEVHVIGRVIWIGRRV